MASHQNNTALHPLISSSFWNLLALVARYGVEPRYLPRLFCLLPVTLLRQPVIAWERIRYGRRIARQAILPPIFVIGHWRSGTTHLQNLLCQDPQFARVTLMQAGMPNDFLTLGAFARRHVGQRLPSRRLMDNVPVAADVPWEEELALTSTGRMSFYHVSFFPKAMGRIFQEAVMFDGGSPALESLWQKQYLAFLRKVQLVQPDRPLLLKNPANTARIRHLRRLFPGARFIHIHRNPYEVFASSVHLYLKAQEAWGLHKTNREMVVRHVIESYPVLMNAYLEQRTELEPDQLAEVGFDALRENPMQVLSDLYAQLRLPGFDDAAPRFEAYIESQRDYRMNQLSLPPEEREAVRAAWGPLFERLGYPP